MSRGYVSGVGFMGIAIYGRMFQISGRSRWPSKDRNAWISWSSDELKSLNDPFVIKIDKET